jgi:hypothetical protein
MLLIGKALLALGSVVGLGAVATDGGLSALIAVCAGGFLFVAGAIFAGAAGVQDALRRRF